MQNSQTLFLPTLVFRWLRALPALLRNTAQYLPVFAIAFWATIGTVGGAIFYRVTQRNSWPANLSFMNIWDASHYLQIAETGYSPAGTKDFWENIVFFPLYPALIKLLWGLGLNRFNAAILISNTFYALSMVYLYVLVSLDFPKRLALRAVLFISVFPTAYFFHLGYSESLFLFGVLGALYHSACGRWGMGSLHAIVAGLSRQPGYVVIPCLLAEWWLQKRKAQSDNTPLFWIACGSLGTLSYLMMNLILYDNPLYFTIPMAECFNRKLAWPWTGLHFAATFWRGINNNIFWGFSDIVSGVAAYFVALFSFRRLRPPIALFAVLYALAITCNSRWGSTARYLLVDFPLFMLVAIYFKKSLWQGLLAFLGGALNMFMLVRFLNQQWAF